ncbi:MAG: hypothetical protein KAH32_01510, partial [Chlamydiia bacterium]|nr:hypothetical protein [Chlamydiia bacterium]
MTTVFENVLGMPIVEQNLLSIQKIPLVELPGQLFDKYIDITDSLFSKIGIDNASVHIERSNLLTQSSNINSCDLSIILSISSINGNIRIKIPESDFDILLSKSINKNYVPLISLDSKKYL